LKKKTPEGMLKASIRQLLDVCGIFYYNAWGGPMSPKGVPDLICCQNGRFIGIEVKTPAGKVSGDQEEFIRRINEAGGLGFIARSLEDVLDTLQLNDRFLRFK
jgi:hypothetical protein